jgi:hypothetical protein
MFQTAPRHETQMNAKQKSRPCGGFSQKAPTALARQSRSHQPLRAVFGRPHSHLSRIFLSAQSVVFILSAGNAEYSSIFPRLCFRCGRLLNLHKLVVLVRLDPAQARTGRKEPPARAPFRFRLGVRRRRDLRWRANDYPRLEHYLRPNHVDMRDGNQHLTVTK